MSCSIYEAHRSKTHNFYTDITQVVHTFLYDNVEKVPPEMLAILSELPNLVQSTKNTQTYVKGNISAKMWQQSVRPNNG